jgi:hypothetical protein
MLPPLANQSQLVMLMIFPLRRLSCYRNDRGFRAWCAAASRALRLGRLPEDCAEYPLACFLSGRRYHLAMVWPWLHVTRRWRGWEKIDPVLSHLVLPPSKLGGCRTLVKQVTPISSLGHGTDGHQQMAILSVSPPLRLC